MESLNNNYNYNEVLIKRETLVVPELGALYRKKESRTVQQQYQANSSMDSTPADTTYITERDTEREPVK